MNILQDIEPKEVLRLFEALCDLPRGSRNTKLISDYCLLFARVRGFSCQQDKANNVIIRKEASIGYADHPPVILQAHLDMVCERTADSTIDFRRDGLSLRVEGDSIRADGTTLGADDGIGVAMALAILDNKNLQHPPLEIILTSDEEVGMLGATALDTSSLEGRMLINLDSEKAGVLTVGCAGGAHCGLSLPLSREGMAGTPYTLQIDGLTGGHSGTDIGSERTNAIHFLAALFSHLCETHDLRLFGFSGGGKDNAIPRSATLKFIAATPLSDAETAYLDTALEALRESEPNATITLRAGAVTSLGALTKDCTDKVRAFFAQIPNGVVKMSEELPGTVQTSLNLGSLTFERSLNLSLSVRSSSNNERTELCNQLRKLITDLGGQYRQDGVYPAWEYLKESHLCDTMKRVWQNLVGSTCRTEVIHAGLECGIFASKIKGLDCVSIGPDIFDIHTPRETLSISSVQLVWNYLREVLKAL